ncbi:MAG: hypothetical protein KGH67_03560 [Candidatus Micrarchaeota archaeon]|nr:hypothetical protein [Candidatus Micrarchaeota archaeon]MDE1859579.1 hypothetical protein [Candidatus Micrarchaeota archaeon]
MAGAAAACKDTYNVLVISELNGAKKYMYDEGLIGLAHYLKSLAQPEEPYMFVIGGGLLPEIPGKGGPRNMDKLRVLRDGVKNFDDAAAVMKPHMERMFSPLPDLAQIVYVMGPADQSNIQEINRHVSLNYADAVRMMQQGNKAAA